MFLYRAFAKARKVRVPTGNPREAINVIIPPRITHDTQTFTAVARSMHGRVITAFNEFTELNPADIVNDSKSKVTMKLPEGDFSVEYDVGRQELTYFSPISGVHRYFYELVNERWVCERNGHFFEELIVREYLNLGKGYLNL